MKTQVQKWGNSLAVRIPKAFAANLGLAQDSSVELALEDGNLVVRPSPSPKYQLSELLDRVTENNMHTEEDYGARLGTKNGRSTTGAEPRRFLIRVYLNPQAGHEQAGRRPALVISPVEYNGRVGIRCLCAQSLAAPRDIPLRLRFLRTLMLLVLFPPIRSRVSTGELEGRRSLVELQTP